MSDDAEWGAAVVQALMESQERLALEVRGLNAALAAAEQRVAALAAALAIGVEHLGLIRDFSPACAFDIAVEGLKRIAALTPAPAPVTQGEK